MTPTYFMHAPHATPGDAWGTDGYSVPDGEARCQPLSPGPREAHDGPAAGPARRVGGERGLLLTHTEYVEDGSAGSGGSEAKR
jgi:hypothetical protein